MQSEGGKREEEENRKRERETGLRTTATPFWRPVRRVLKVLFRFGAMRQKSFTTADRDRERGGEGRVCDRDSDKDRVVASSST